jgi:hypothetical protein
VVLFSDCKIRFVLNQVGVCSEKAKCSSIDSLLTGTGLCLYLTEEDVPVPMRKEIHRKGFDEDSIADLHYMESRLFRDDDLPTLHTLTMQSVDVGARVSSHNPEVGSESCRILRVALRRHTVH